MVFKTDEDMSLDKYWEKHCISIAKDRRWAIQKGDQYSFENCATLRQCDDYIKKVASYLDMSISEITPANILHASPRSPSMPIPRSHRQDDHLVIAGRLFLRRLHADMLTTFFKNRAGESQIILRL